MRIGVDIGGTTISIGLLDESGCIRAYLIPHYDVLHTQSSQYVLEDIEQYLRVRGIVV